MKNLWSKFWRSACILVGLQSYRGIYVQPSPNEELETMLVYVKAYALLYTSFEIDKEYHGFVSSLTNTYPQELHQIGTGEEAVIHWPRNSLLGGRRQDGCQEPPSFCRVSFIYQTSSWNNFPSTFTPNIDRKKWSLSPKSSDLLIYLNRHTVLSLVQGVGLLAI